MILKRYSSYCCLLTAGDVALTMTHSAREVRLKVGYPLLQCPFPDVAFQLRNASTSPPDTSN
jgi:hypothetical protein